MWVLLSLEKGGSSGGRAFCGLGKGVGVDINTYFTVSRFVVVCSVYCVLEVDFVGDCLTTSCQHLLFLSKNCPSDIRLKLRGYLSFEVLNPIRFFDLSSPLLLPS